MNIESVSMFSVAAVDVCYFRSIMLLPQFSLNQFQV